MEPQESPVKKDDPAHDLRECLYRVGRVSERVSDLEQLLFAIIQECAMLLDCDAASVAIYNAESDDLTFAVASGEAGSQIRQVRMKMGEGIVGRVARERQPYFTNDPAGDPAWSGKADKSSSFHTRNLAAVPMVRQESLIGVLEVVNRRGGRDFHGADLELLQLFADQVAIAIENHRLMLAMRDSERMATFGVALADIGHSIKNILMRLEFPIKLIEKSIEDGNWEMLNGGWPTMRRATKDIGALVREMLDYSKRDKPTRTRVDVAKLVGEVVEECRPDAVSKSIALTLDGAGQSLEWTIDAPGLRYALHNLIGNSIEAIAELHCGSAVRVTLAGDEAAGMLTLSIADDGPGIPLEIQKRIFDPFFTTKKSKGTGLGLANVKKNVEGHGGRVTLESAPGQGATFILSYPREFAD